MNNIPKILHLVISLEHGGLERLVVNWTRERNHRSSHSTFVCCLDKMGVLADDLDGGEVFCVDSKRSRFPWDAAAVRRLADLIKDLKIDIVHSHNIAAQQYGVLAARRAGIKHVYTQHGANVHNLGLKDKLRSRILCALTDEIVAVSESVKKSMVERQGIAERKIEVVRNGVAEKEGFLAECWHPVLASGTQRSQRRGKGEELSHAHAHAHAHAVAGSAAEFAPAVAGSSTENAEGEEGGAVVSKQAAGVRGQESGDRGETSGLRLQVSGLKSVRKTLGIPEDAFVIGSVGRLAHVKGYDRLISAFAEMCKKGGLSHAELAPAVAESSTENAEWDVEGFSRQVSGVRFHPLLLLVGDGPERASLESLARDLILNCSEPPSGLRSQVSGFVSRVVFAGFQKDVDKYYAAMDLFVLPSRSEGLPIALLEAMATGVPVAVTDVGECREVIEDGKCGLLLPDEEDLWSSVISNQWTVISEQRNEIKKRAKARVREMYSMCKTMEAYEVLFQKLLI